MGPPKPNQDRASGPQEKGGTSQLTATPPHPRSFECQRSQGWAHCMRQSPGPGACGHVAPSVGLVPLPSVCSVPMGGRPAGPGVTHTPGTLTSLPLPLPSPPQVLLSPRPWHSPPSPTHLSLSLSAFIFISFFLFFLCAPSRGAVTEEKGPATWE